MKRPNPPSIITVAVITTITIIFWIFFSVYQILTSEPDVDVPEILLKPISPTLNQEVLSTLSDGVEYQKDSVTHFSAREIVEEDTSLESPTVTPTINPTTTPPEIELDEEIEQATPEGDLVE